MENVLPNFRTRNLIAARVIASAGDRERFVSEYSIPKKLSIRFPVPENKVCREIVFPDDLAK
jgi:hypothetical protein